MALSRSRKVIFMYSDEFLSEVFGHFEAPEKPDRFELCTIGHINTTYFVWSGDDFKYVLQKINTGIFKKPDELIENILNVTEFIRNKIEAAGGDPKREVLRLVPCRDAGYIYRDPNGGVWRLYDAIVNAVTYQSAELPGLFYSSAYAFGRFQKQLADFPAEKLHETIVNFHNTVSRYSDFEKALEEDIAGRAASVVPEIEFVREHKDLCSYIVDRIASGEYPLRVTHNDTKLNNVMIDNDTHRALCVIDLDTVMPGSVLYDFGDSIRFGASSASEDEHYLDKVYMKLDLFEEYLKGFLDGLDNSLTEAEIDGLPYGAIVITFENGIRFLTDHLNGDVYFAKHYENQNLYRTRTQFKLVADMIEKLPEMQKIIERNKTHKEV